MFNNSLDSNVPNKDESPRDAVVVGILSQITQIDSDTIQTILANFFRTDSYSHTLISKELDLLDLEIKFVASLGLDTEDTDLTKIAMQFSAVIYFIIIKDLDSNRFFDYGEYSLGQIIADTVLYKCSKPEYVFWKKEHGPLWAKLFSEFGISANDNIEKYHSVLKQSPRRYHMLINTEEWQKTLTGKMPNDVAFNIISGVLGLIMTQSAMNDLLNSLNNLGQESYTNDS